MDFLVANGAALLFWLFAAGAVVGAVLVVVLRNPMYGAFALLGCFLSVAALFLLRRAEFLAVVQIFVYGGGIMVLFLFVIMLVNLHRLRETRLFLGQAPLALVLGVLLAAVFGLVFAGAGLGPPDPDPQAMVRVGGQALGNSEAVAWTLYRDYLLPFEVASVFLLVAMIGAVVLGRRQ
jgi:NADH-quinone oxidoreductase subunit J